MVPLRAASTTTAGLKCATLPAAPILAAAQRTLFLTYTHIWLPFRTVSCPSRDRYTAYEQAVYNQTVTWAQVWATVANPSPIHATVSSAGPLNLATLLAFATQSRLQSLTNITCVDFGILRQGTGPQHRGVRGAPSPAFPAFSMFMAVNREALLPFALHSLPTRHLCSSLGHANSLCSPQVLQQPRRPFCPCPLPPLPSNQLSLYVSCTRYCACTMVLCMHYGIMYALWYYVCTMVLCTIVLWYESPKHSNTDTNTRAHTRTNAFCAAACPAACARCAPNAPNLCASAAHLSSWLRSPRCDSNRLRMCSLSRRVKL